MIHEASSCSRHAERIERGHDGLDWPQHGPALEQGAKKIHAEPLPVGGDVAAVKIESVGRRAAVDPERLEFFPAERTGAAGLGKLAIDAELRRTFLVQIKIGSSLLSGQATKTVDKLHILI